MEGVQLPGFHQRHRRPRRGRRQRCRKPPEAEAYVLDYRPPNPEDRHPEHREHDYFQLLGADYFTLMEALPRVDMEIPIEVGARIQLVGEESIIRECSTVLIEYGELSPYAKSKLEEILPDIVREKEKVFVEFFNIAGPINIRFHSLELLPGIGKKTLMRILEERERKPFESFEDIRERVRIDPVKVIAERILRELQGGERYYLFVHPPPWVLKQRRDIIVFDVLRELYRRVRGGGETAAEQQESAARVDEEAAKQPGATPQEE